MSKKVLIAIADGTEELEAVTIIDILRRAGADITVAATKHPHIVCSRLLKITADTVIADCKDNDYDLIVLPGGLPGAEHLRDCTDLIEMLKKQNAAGKLYAAICASPAVALHPHGLLEGKKATSYPAPNLNFPGRSDEKVVIDDNCITSQGPGTAMEFSLKLTELLFGLTQRNEVAKALLAE
ncbi:MAG: DJ-1 family glyoxalase III [Planctomycetota bacterium]|jgi:4-methyl-5(b-hydroxyethyl)-thiazole monophosphate biosynthesis